MSDERINSVETRNYDITRNLNYYGTKTWVEINGSCSKQDKVSFDHEKVVSIYIVFDISKSISSSDYPTPEKCLFGAVSLTKNAFIDKCKYSVYGIEFDRRGSFSFPGTGLGRNVVIFGLDISSSTREKRHFDFG